MRNSSPPRGGAADCRLANASRKDSCDLSTSSRLEDNPFRMTFANSRHKRLVRVSPFSVSSSRRTANEQRAGKILATSRPSSRIEPLQPLRPLDQARGSNPCNLCDLSTKLEDRKHRRQTLQPSRQARGSHPTRAPRRYRHKKRNHQTMAVSSKWHPDAYAGAFPMVEDTRFELVTSCMPCKRSNQLS